MERSLIILEWYHGITRHVVLICQPYAKRARHELPEEEEYRAAVQAAAGALGAIESLLQQSVPPDWLLTEMEALHERIDELKRRVV